MRRIQYLLLLFFATIFRVNGQCPVSSFTVQPNSCRSEMLALSNQSDAGSSEWDFCSGDFSNSPTAALSYHVTGAIGRPGMELVKNGNTWWGFLTGTYTSNLFRLQFSNGVNNPPTFVENLGTLGGKLNNPGQVRIIQEGGLWYGFVHNTVSGEVIKLSFGTSPGNAYTATTYISGISNSTGSSGMAFGKDAINGWVCILSLASNNFFIARLGDLSTSPGPGDILSTSLVPLQSVLGDIDLVSSCGNWYGFADNYGSGNVFRLDFGPNLFSNPTITPIASLPVSNPGRLRMAKEGTNYFLLVTSLDGKLEKLSFGNDITSTPSLNEEGGGTPANMYGLALAKDNSTWTVYTVDFTDGDVYQVKYPDNCTASPRTSQVANPTVSYSAQGAYNISVQTTNSAGSTAATKSVTVSSLVAPDIDFTTTNFCAGSNVLFNSVNTSGGIASYSWDFNDGGTSSMISPSHIFSSTGNYAVTNTITGTNGCQNFAARSVPVYRQPVVDFNLPNPSVVCTNQLYDFVNTTAYDSLSLPTWQWFVNGTQVSTAKDLLQNFTVTANNTVELISTIAGCAPTTTKSFNVIQQGPVVDFVAANGCQARPVTFTNNTSGSVTSWLWDFGDTNTSAAASPQHSFTTNTSYTVKLTATNSAGCNNYTSKPITIYSTPSPDFVLALPPFSCSGSASQFSDATPNLTDSNISSWAWTFGDASGGTSVLQNPAYVYATAGNYNAELTVTTNFNCSATIQKQITISASPVASFSAATACANQNTQFMDLSGPTIKSRTWKITSGSSSLPVSSIANPVYVFPGSGNYSAVLNVTDNDGCIAQTSKTIVVPVPLLADYSYKAACTNQLTVFTNTTPVTSDPQTGTSWNFDNKGTATGSTASYTFTSSSNVSVTMAVTAQSGCVYSVSKSISIVPVPAAAFTVASDTGTPPFKVEFTNTSTAGASYLWQFNDAIQSTSNLTSPSFTYLLPGEYKVILTAFNSQNCSDTTSKIINVIPARADLALTKLDLVPDLINGGYKIVVTVTNNGNAVVVNPSISVRTSDAVASKETLSTTLAPSAVATQTLKYEVPQGAGTYVCATIDETGDSNESNNELCTALTNQDVLMAPYPNPTTSDFHIDLIAARPGMASATIYSIIGEVVMAETVYSTIEGLNTFTFGPSTFRAGIYLINFKYDGNQKSFRVIVN